MDLERLIIPNDRKVLKFVDSFVPFSSLPAEE